MDIQQDLLSIIITGVTRVAIFIAIIILGRIVSKLLVNALEKILRRSKVDETLVNFFSSITYYSLLLLVVVVGLGVLGLPMTSVIAVLGASVLVIGIALQDSLANLAAGVIIIGLRPFEVGHYIEMADDAGYVDAIGFFNTMLTTRDNKTVFIPNKNLLAGSLINYSKTELIRLELVYGISYSDDIGKAKSILEDILINCMMVASDPAPTVGVKELGDNSVNFVVRPYVSVREELEVSDEITEQVKLRFDREGISIPFPQRDVHLFQPN
ncbi:MAG TPA: mechanosensitive ion channel domain-containing protein [candidate division Zixibacteria bacterium]|nr:mechanosensitive ion channel domain-containing protein [candidate division Zixibacteria bacterium]